MRHLILFTTHTVAKEQLLDFPLPSPNLPHHWHNIILLYHIFNNNNNNNNNNNDCDVFQIISISSYVSRKNHEEHTSEETIFFIFQNLQYLQKQSSKRIERFINKNSLCFHISAFIHFHLITQVYYCNITYTIITFFNCSFVRLQKSLQRTRTCNGALFPKRTYHTTYLPFQVTKLAIQTLNLQKDF